MYSTAGMGTCVNTPSFPRTLSLFPFSPIDQRKGFSGRQGEEIPWYTPVALLFISSH